MEEEEVVAVDVQRVVAARGAHDEPVDLALVGHDDGVLGAAAVRVGFGLLQVLHVLRIGKYELQSRQGWRIGLGSR